MSVKNSRIILKGASYGGLTYPVLALLLTTSLAARAQTARVKEIIERSLALTPDLSEGSGLYRAHCSSCHAWNGHGDARAVVPSLAGQVS